MLFKHETVLIVLATLIGVLKADGSFNIDDNNNNNNVDNGVAIDNDRGNQLNPRYNGPNRYENPGRYDNPDRFDRYGNRRDGLSGVDAELALRHHHHHHHHRRHCQAEKYEHPVRTKKYSDSTGYWVLYTQIIETRNVANRCHKNEYVYLAHRQKAGWFWNPKITSLVHYSLGEPNFVSRMVRHPEREFLRVTVNMSKNYAPSAVDLDRIFPRRLAKEMTRIGGDDAKWSQTARTSLPILQMNTAYIQTVIPKENTGSRHLKVLHDDRINREILE